MIVLDHNIPRDQQEALRRFGIRTHHVGFEIGRPEWADREEVLRYLHRVKQPTFFTRDVGFLHIRLWHPGYCLVVLTGGALHTARDIRRFLRHRSFRTRAHRMGRLVKLTPTGILVRRRGGRAQRVGW